MIGSTRGRKKGSKRVVNRQKQNKNEKKEAKGIPSHNAILRYDPLRSLGHKGVLGVLDLNGASFFDSAASQVSKIFG